MDLGKYVLLLYPTPSTLDYGLRLRCCEVVWAERSLANIANIVHACVTVQPTNAPKLCPDVPADSSVVTYLTVVDLRRYRYVRKYKCRSVFILIPKQFLHFGTEWYLVPSGLPQIHLQSPSRQASNVPLALIMLVGRNYSSRVQTSNLNIMAHTPHLSAFVLQLLYAVKDYLVKDSTLLSSMPIEAPVQHYRLYRLRRQRGTFGTEIIMVPGIYLFYLFFPRYSSTPQKWDGKKNRVIGACPATTDCIVLWR